MCYPVSRAYPPFDARHRGRHLNSWAFRGYAHLFPYTTFSYISFGNDYDLFIKGVVCEKRGLGIGAFTYYRRVVEAQKNHLIAEILRAAEKLGAPKDSTDKLKASAQEKQFTRAVDSVKGAIPESLLVDSHNPLKLLHDALSICVHAETDETCLHIAHNIRLVLADLVERIRLALGEQDELRTAVSDLLKFNSEAKKRSKESQQ